MRVVCEAYIARPTSWYQFTPEREFYTVVEIAELVSHKYCHICEQLSADNEPCWRASEASETLSGVYKFELVRYIYIYIRECGSTLYLGLTTPYP